MHPNIPSTTKKTNNLKATSNSKKQIGTHEAHTGFVSDHYNHIPQNSR